MQNPGTAYDWTTYDAFNRPHCAVSACGNMTCTTYHALTTDVCDPLDMAAGTIFTDTCTTTRNDGHGRAIDQVLRNVPAEGGAMEFYRLWTQYRADGAVIQLTRAETATDSSPTSGNGHHVERTFTYDTMGRRIGTTDPDSDSTSGNIRDTTWRYLYNEAGDLVAVRDPRGCGQNFYYDRLGLLIGEDYVECGEIQSSGDTPSETVPATSVLLAELGTAKAVDVRYFYDAPPTWANGYSEVTASDYEGRLAGVSDRGQRSAMAYDARGQVVWAARQMVVIGAAPSVTMTDASTANGVPPVVSEGSVTPAARAYDDEADHTYERTARYDYGGRPRSMVLPTDPDWETFGGTGTAPAIGGTLEYDERGLPSRVALAIDDVEERAIVEDLHYNVNGLVCRVVYGDNTAVGGGSRSPTFSETTYDTCLRPETFHTERVATSYGGLDPRPLALVTTPMSQSLVWDAASNLVQVADLRDGDEWPDGYRPQSVDVGHDALYRVSFAEYTYTQDMMGTAPDSARDWRVDQATTRSGDPMRTTPAAMVPTLPDDRVDWLEWTYDWLGNMQEWNDDAESFYERSIGNIENGADRATPERPAALHLATNIRHGTTAPTEIDVGVDRGGWVELTYGEDGNVVAMTVHGQCKDASSITACYDDEDLEGAARASGLRAGCVCAVEQHYQYRWDELNRLAEARRFDRAGGADWTFEVRQRYRYDSGNQRTIKQTIATSGSDPERIALYVYPGDWERRGLVRGTGGDVYDASTGLDSETQYMVGGARVVWKHGDAIAGLDRDQRVTVPLTDLIQTTAAVLDLNSGELLEASTYYPNGARESLRVQDEIAVAGEPAGFTGHEADEEVGLVYFGERYLLSSVGRWATPDPLQLASAGGGEAINSYHYIGGSLLQARDPVGLNCEGACTSGSEGRFRGTLPEDGFEYGGEAAPDGSLNFDGLVISGPEGPSVPTGGEIDDAGPPAPHDPRIRTRGNGTDFRPGGRDGTPRDGGTPSGRPAPREMNRLAQYAYLISVLHGFNRNDDGSPATSPHSIPTGRCTPGGVIPCIQPGPLLNLFIAVVGTIAMAPELAIKGAFAVVKAASGFARRRVLNLVPVINSSSANGGPAPRFRVRRFMSAAEFRLLKKTGLKYVPAGQPGGGGGIPTTTRNFTPRNQGHARRMTGARHADYQVDFDVTGVPRGATTNTKRGLPEYPIQGDLTSDMIIGVQDVPPGG